MVKVGYLMNQRPQDERIFKDNDEFIEWLHRQLDIEPITILFMNEQE